MSRGLSETHLNDALSGLTLSGVTGVTHPLAVPPPAALSESGASPSSSTLSDVSDAVHSLSTLLTAAERCEGDTVGRLALNTSAACDGLAFAVSNVVDCVSELMRDVRLKLKRQCASRDKRLQWQCEEFDAGKALLESCEHQLRAEEVVDMEALEESMSTAKQIVSEVNALPTHAAVVSVADDKSSASTLVGLSHVQIDVDVDRCIVSHPTFLRRGEVNSVSVACLDSVGVPVRSLAPADVSVIASALPGKAESTGWSIGVPCFGDGGVVTLCVTPEVGGVDEAELVMTLCGCFRVPFSLKAGSSILGSHIRTLAIGGSSNSGLAINHGGTVMAISNEQSNTVAVYDLAKGALQVEFGGKGRYPGRFRYPKKMWFSPRNGSHVLIVDFFNKCVQEMTTAGVGVRTIGASVILGTICGLAANTDMIVVGVWDRSSPAGGKQVLMFDFVSGDLLRSFGVKGTAEGQLHGIVGIRFTPDDRHIILAETDGNRLSLFTLTGDFVRCIGVDTLRAPWDVDFATNGDILVADSSNHRICVFSPDGSTLLRAFGSEGSSEPGTFKHPIALAMHAGQLYVLDWKSARVQVFS